LVLENIRDEPAAVIYVDPPYFDKNGKYIHDFEDADHERLAELLGRFKHTKIIVSYYDHPKLEVLYPGGIDRIFRRPDNRCETRQRARSHPPQVNTKKIVEVLLVNKRPREPGLF